MQGSWDETISVRDGTIRRTFQTERRERAIVRRVQKDSTGAEAEREFVYAGVKTYEKVDSSFEPPD